MNITDITEYIHPLRIRDKYAQSTQNTHKDILSEYIHHCWSRYSDIFWHILSSLKCEIFWDFLPFLDVLHARRSSRPPQMTNRKIYSDIFTAYYDIFTAYSEIFRAKFRGWEKFPFLDVPYVRCSIFGCSSNLTSEYVQNMFRICVEYISNRRTRNTLRIPQNTQRICGHQEYVRINKNTQGYMYPNVS